MILFVLVYVDIVQVAAHNAPRRLYDKSVTLALVGPPSLSPYANKNRPKLVEQTKTQTEASEQPLPTAVHFRRGKAAA